MPRHRFKVLDGRTRAGRVAAQVRFALNQELGGKPTPLQHEGIERIVHLRLQIWHLEQDAAISGRLSQQQQWAMVNLNNAMSKALELLPIRGAGIHKTIAKVATPGAPAGTSALLAHLEQMATGAAE